MLLTSYVVTREITITIVFTQTASSKTKFQISIKVKYKLLFISVRLGPIYVRTQTSQIKSIFSIL
jgi:hypothetical protein